MSSRGRLGTVLRVAELRERVARGVAAADTLAVRRAAEVEQDRRTHLATAPRSADLRLAAAQGALRAGAVAAADEAAQAARSRSEWSVAEYVQTARRAALLADLVARKSAEQAADAIAAEQRLVDDLGGSTSKERS